MSGEPNTYSAAINESEKEQQFLTTLRNKTKTYPHVTESSYDGKTYLSTNVRIRLNGLYYLINCKYIAVLTPLSTKLDAYKSFMADCYTLIINPKIDKRLLVPENLDKDQVTDEVTRMQTFKYW